MLRLIWKIEVSDSWSKKDRHPTSLHSGQGSVNHDEGGADMKPVRKEGLKFREEGSGWQRKKKRYADGKTSLPHKELKTGKKANQRLGRDRCKTCYKKLKLLRKILEFFKARISFKAVPSQHHVLQVNKWDRKWLDGLQRHPASAVSSRPVPTTILTSWHPSSVPKVLALGSAALAEHQGNNQHEPLVPFLPLLSSQSILNYFPYIID